jgi:hypothetical protein
MDVIEAFQPDMYQALCDGDTNLTSSKKRIQKSVGKSVIFLEKCLERHKKSEVKILCTSRMAYQGKDKGKFPFCLSIKL